MKNLRSFLVIAALMLTGAVTFISCNKNFDTPPAPGDPSGLTATESLRTFRARHTVAGQIDTINTDIVISGIVCANDKSGNIYKNLYIQDGTAALQLNLDQSSMYTTYPIGRRIFIKCKGLALTDVSNMVQLGILDYTTPSAPTFQDIPNKKISDYIIGGSLGNAVTTYTVTAKQLTSSMQDTLQSNLVRLEGYAFDDPTKTYSDVSPAKATTNLGITGCDKSKLIVRTSGYANFAGLKPDTGRGSIAAVYTVFKTTPQLILRDTADVNFDGTRNSCSAFLPPFISIADLKAQYSGTDISIAANTIKGIVISDAGSGKNITAGNLVLQDGKSGIDLYFGSSAATQLATFKPGDSLVIDISGGKLTSFNGQIELSMASSSVPTDAALTAANGAGKSVVPVTMTVKEVADNIAAIENTLVKIVNATATPAGTYSGNKTLTDASGAMILRTVTTASFAGSTLPATCQNWVGYVSRFNTDKQLYIRDPATDVTAGTACGSGGGGGGGSSVGVILTSSPTIIDFNGLPNALPQGVYAYNGATAGALGTAQTVTLDNKYHWATIANGPKMYASASGLSAVSDSAAQAASTNRALGYRQTSANGDPGAAFVFLLDNTSGKTSIAMSFQLQSLDATSPRTVNWKVDYGFGDTPTSFTTATSTGTVSTGNSSWTNNLVTVDFANGIDNKSQKVWIRITPAAGSTGSGNRPTTAVDDVKFTWN